jgi:hypothetical protein
MFGRPAYVLAVARALPATLYTTATCWNGFVAFELKVSGLWWRIFPEVLTYSFDLALTTTRASLGNARISCSHLMQTKLLE